MHVNYWPIIDYQTIRSKANRFFPGHGPLRKEPVSIRMERKRIMDRRKQKTLRAIRNAFLELRSRMPLEKITVRELSDLAEISKATFYLHYADIYALSEQLQREVIEEILRGVTRDEKLLTDIEQTSKASAPIRPSSASCFQAPRLPICPGSLKKGSGTAFTKSSLKRRQTLCSTSF